MKIKNVKIFLHFILLFFISSLVSCFLTNETSAAGASLYLSPSNGVYSINSNFLVQLKVDTNGQNINVAEGSLVFDPDKISVVSLSEKDSIFSLWIEKPNFSNIKGTISFRGGTPESFNGSSGTILSITFKAKSGGSAEVKFSSGLVLAADYKGTNILAAMAGGVYTFEPTIIIPSVPEYIPPKNAPQAPFVSSPTHPDSERWYSNNDPKFTWKVTEDIIGVKLLANHQPIAIPTIFYSEPISEKELKDLENGVWYFHVQLRNKYGWGGISHFKFQIDNQSPLPFEIKIKEGRETTNPRPTLIFETIDDVSGVDHYELKIDQRPVIKTEETRYQAPFLDLGDHTVVVKAVDRADNYILVMTEIKILPIETPSITEYPQTLLPGSILSLKGMGPAEATIKPYIQKDRGQIRTGETKSDKEGKWFYVETEPLERGVYKIWAEAVDSSGGRSWPSEKIVLSVVPPTFIRVGELAIDYLTTIVTLLILIFVIILGVFWGWQKIRQKRKRSTKEVVEAEEALHKAFEILKRKVEEQIGKLDGKQGLSKREAKICDDLKKALKISEKIISKEIKDIKEELK